MFSHFLHIFSSVSPKRIKRVFYKIKYSELMFFIYVCVKKQMNYTTYLFDFDYTLADSSHGIVTCFRNVLNRHGYTRRPHNDIKRIHRQDAGRIFFHSFRCNRYPPVG